jgi:signal transduction histidine kinase
MDEAEQARLRALDAALVWETPSEPRFDDIAMLAATLGRARIGLVSFVGRERQWFKARHGTDIPGTPRALSLCDEVVRTGAPVVAFDLRADGRFVEHPLLAADPRIGFYAGYPVWFDGQVVGTVCVVDDEPRAMTTVQRDGLRALAAQVEALLELRRRVARSVASEQVKSRFLRNMSHELRTPLNAVLGFARVLQRERHGKLSPEQASYVRDMVDGGEHMLRLVNDLLDLQWIEEGRATLDRRLVSPRTVGEDAVRLVRQLAEERDQRIAVAFAADGAGDLSVRVDRGRMVQVLVNLLSNAIKFTAPGGHIRLSIEATAQGATFTVEDDGIGISESDQPRVFEEFARVGDTAHSRGLGLGLALSKRLVEEHGGTVRVTSALGVGSRFVVRLPRAEASAA